MIIELPGPYYEVHKRSGFMLQVEDKPAARAYRKVEAEHDLFGSLLQELSTTKEDAKILVDRSEVSGTL